MKLHKLIDHTLLSPFAEAHQAKKLCEEAIIHQFYSVCISPYFVPFCRQHLSGSQVRICTVIGFPFGYNSIASKQRDIESLLPTVDEFDIVINLQAVTNEDFNLIDNEAELLTNHVQQEGKVVKWIVESGNISSNHLRTLCDIMNTHRPDFIKTSTGVLGAGATLEAVTTMREYLHNDIQIKASGGIRDRQTALAMIQAGASRIGASKSVQIVGEE